MYVILGWHPDTKYIPKIEMSNTFIKLSGGRDIHKQNQIEID